MDDTHRTYVAFYYETFTYFAEVQFKMNETNLLIKK